MVLYLLRGSRFSFDIAHFGIEFLCRTLSTMHGQHWIAVCQMSATADKKENLDTCERLISEASHQKAEMVFLPENCDYMVACGQKKIDMAETIDGPTVRHIQACAKKYNVWVSVGGMHERSPNPDCRRIRITHLIIDNKGSVVSIYRKSHLFGLTMENCQTVLQESESTASGNSLQSPVETPVGLVGMQICYDIRFPEASNVLAQKGAEILTYPSAFTVVTGSAHWEVLLRARAIENQCYVVAAAQVGTHDQNRQTYGHAMVVDPWGAVVTNCGARTGFSLAEIDLDYLHTIRRRMPVFKHRRYDLYNNPMKVD